MHLESMRLSKPETRSHSSGNITTTYRFYFLNIKPAYIYPFAICSSSSARTTMKASNLVTLPTLVPLPLSLFFTTELSWYIPSTNLITDPWFKTLQFLPALLWYCHSFTSPEAFPACCAVGENSILCVSSQSGAHAFPTSYLDTAVFCLCSSLLTFLISTQLEFPQRNFPWTLDQLKAPIISSQSTLHLYLSFEALSEVEPYVCVINDICFSLLPVTSMKGGHTLAHNCTPSSSCQASLFSSCEYLRNEWMNTDLGNFQKLFRCRTGRRLDFLQASRKHF